MPEPGDCAGRTLGCAACSVSWRWVTPEKK